MADAGDGNNYVNVQNYNNADPNISYQLSAGGGSDNFYVSAAGNVVLDAGDGSNYINVYGNGNRNISAGSGNDYFSLGANTYDYQQQGKTFSYALSAGDGDDSINLQNLFIYNYYNENLNVVVNADAGNDVIYAPQPYDSYSYGLGVNGSLQINGGDGNDVLHFGSQYTYSDYGFTSATVSLGAGSDTVVIDLAARKLNFDVSSEELEARRKEWTAPAPKYKRGWLARYTKLVTNASNGAILE